MKNINSHFVTRGLTKPWEINEQRELAYYDFTNDRISTHFSKSLFSKKGLFNSEEEQIFNERIETPLINLRNKLKENKHHSFNQQEWEALAMYFQFQTIRYSAKEEGRGDMFNFFKKNVLSNDSIAKSSASAMYQYCQFFHFEQQKDRYFFPENGCIIIPTSISIPNSYHKTDLIRIYCKGIIGIPFSPRWIFVICPKPIVDFLNNHYKLMAELFIYLGVGCGGSLNRVLIPPDLYKKYNENKLRNLICNYRELSRETLSYYNELMQLAQLSANPTYTESS